MGVTMLNNRLYVVGGCDDNLVCLNSNLCLDIKNPIKWIEMEKTKVSI